MSCVSGCLWISSTIDTNMAEMETRLAIKFDMFVIVSKNYMERWFALSQTLGDIQPCRPPEGTCYAKVIIVKGNLKYIPTNWQQHKRGNWKMTEDMLRPNPLLKFVEMFSHIKGKQSIRSLMMKELPKSPVDWRSLRCMTPLNLSWRSYLYSAAIRSVRRDQMSRLN